MTSEVEIHVTDQLRSSLEIAFTEQKSYYKMTTLLS